MSKKKIKKSPVDCLSDSQIYLLKDTFDMFDREGEGKIATSEVPQMFEVLGLDVPEEKIEECVQEVDTDQSGFLNFPEFLLMMCDQMGDQDKVMEEVVKCFKAFDEEQTGMIKAKQIIEVMVLMGDKMGKMDVEEMMALAGVEDGYVDYEYMIDIVAKGSKNETPEEKFDSIDKDGNGKITREEFANAVKGK